jgi:hypothetical protein
VDQLDKILWEDNGLGINTNAFGWTSITSKPISILLFVNNKIPEIFEATI